MTPRLQLWWFLYWVLLVVFAIFAYGLTVPNLVLTQWPPFWEFQTWMWHTFFNHRPTTTYTYLTLINLLFVMYGGIIWASLKLPVVRIQKHSRYWVLFFIALVVPLMIGYNALSTDIFNYIFNAKIIAVYNANPYIQVALDFPNDTWTRFMHNIHTPSPYGWGWTIMTVGLFKLGLEKFFPTWLIFKGAGTLSLLLFAGLGWWGWLSGRVRSFSLLLLVVVNPLFLLEYGLNAHNDLWMMLPAVISLLLLEKPLNKKNSWMIVLSILLLALSISVKIATFVLIPLWFLLVIMQIIKQPKLQQLLAESWPLAAWVLMFIPLLSARSQYFHPWYLGWIMVWIPFLPISAKNWILATSAQLLLLCSLCLSLTSLLRYTPWLWHNGYSEVILYQQRLITWSGVALSAGIFLMYKIISKSLTTRR